MTSELQFVNSSYIRFFSQVGINDIQLVGGKNASLGEMYQSLVPQGVPVPNGFAITSDAYNVILKENDLLEPLHSILDALDVENTQALQKSGAKIRSLIYNAGLPKSLYDEMVMAYRTLTDSLGENFSLAVRSSATAEDLPTASFAGQQDSYLNISGIDDYIDACKQCFASLFNDRAIHYRAEQGFDHFDVSLSVGVQLMVRSDLASSGVMFTVDTESGFEDLILVTGAYGLGENVVQGAIEPDEFYVHKPTFKKGFRNVLKRHLGSKKIKMIYASDAKNGDESHECIENVTTPLEQQQVFCISDQEVMRLAEYAIKIEDYYSKHAGVNRPMDIEWAKDGITGEIMIVQARPETVVSQKSGGFLKQYSLQENRPEALVKGRAVGSRVASGKARVIESAEFLHEFQEGEVLVADMTTPDWEPIMKKAAALVTNRGGRTCHAAIIARELGIPAVVGTEKATDLIKNGAALTVSCVEGDEGRVYDEILQFTETEIDIGDLTLPKTKIKMNLGNPEQAFIVNKIPNEGVGLARMEFIISNSIKVHPQALLNPHQVTDTAVQKQITEITAGYESGREFFIDKLSEGIASIAAGFYPKEVVLRLSDFKTNEYATLIGGDVFEEDEENPMLGFRGAARYNDAQYKESFALECEAVKHVRENLGLENVVIMIPFCRTVEEAALVIDNLAMNGLKRGENGLKVFMMVELPSNVLLMDEFSEYFDGFSIGTNDLTQLVLGVDRDSHKVAFEYDERNAAVKKMVKMAIDGAQRNNKPIGICGQAPSDYPEFAAFLVKEGVSSMSLNPDSVLDTIPIVLEAEEEITLSNKVLSFFSKVG
ncbi:phosphoenolpyruvate synthase [Thiomicrorhabdus sp. Milos-T2]|uniref:phosphoenolpyruvate synthase n=1 Tax=Thiomicrorhabdus sp. Milos-T2 TaxID=90814 RepID=UPI00068B7B1A|nr:phosphoenolpyruvate synthase [Thiomicrorhabdus sp. Milos-T2]